MSHRHYLIQLILCLFAIYPINIRSFLLSTPHTSASWDGTLAPNQVGTLKIFYPGCFSPFLSTLKDWDSFLVEASTFPSRCPCLFPSTWVLLSWVAKPLLSSLRRTGRQGTRRGVWRTIFSLGVFPRESFCERLHSASRSVPFLPLRHPRDERLPLPDRLLELDPLSCVDKENRND